jgi:hypothetical protein
MPFSRQLSEGRRRFHLAFFGARLLVRLPMLLAEILEGFGRIVRFINKLMKRAVRFVAQKDQKDFPGLIVA